MRFPCFALGLILWAVSPLMIATAVQALDVEDHRLFPGTGERVLRVVSTTDLAVFEPYILAFQKNWPEIAVDYTVLSSSDLHRAIRDGVKFDLVVSSAMDLQFQLANDGFAQRYRSGATGALPEWARWRDMIFAFTAEPAVVVINSERLAGLELPATRQELIAILRDNPERFVGAVGTYDVRESGLGFLFATQEDRSTDAYWRLNEVMGRLGPRLYCCSSQMIEDVAEGRLALAYNVLGSYAADQLAKDQSGRMQILRMQDFTNVMLRTVFILTESQEIEAAGAMIDMLARLGLRDLPGDWPLPSLSQTEKGEAMGFGPIRLGPGLMVYLDPLNRRAFLAEWENAMEQR
ncbi:ABC-type Fe3+ transport system, periplasmic component [Hoeflea phototrophica DFL-43]|jgi:iron(III) transport system substrate-binding protein|uniref:ABC-type Fe3+ transport system, periplasmic component n=1 Tax=Hoeflea phototrophica (strain DSM 17068 / NCIMB 14078 / DFL-43) TaxID=411684 RepID=A9D9A5_HOEPD|nr:substrate-binding domain-containing protein [Hoeflea phototrophica]EDQ32895.2 ABC-type Fe3+ transport system, periplasmic component [Hoeflea phototrophica DFL-43]